MGGLEGTPLEHVTFLIHSAEPPKMMRRWCEKARKRLQDVVFEYEGRKLEAAKSPVESGISIPLNDGHVAIHVVSLQTWNRRPQARVELARQVQGTLGAVDCDDSTQRSGYSAEDAQRIQEEEKE